MENRLSFKKGYSLTAATASASLALGDPRDEAVYEIQNTTANAAVVKFGAGAQTADATVTSGAYASNNIPVPANSTVIHRRQKDETHMGYIREGGTDATLKIRAGIE